jgi:hypothetical protein
MTQYKVPLPKDIHNRDIQSGLGTPIAIAASSISATSFGTHYVQVDLSGANAGRNYRHIDIYNPSASSTVYVGFSSSSSAPASASIVVAPGMGKIYDSILLGPNNSQTYIHIRQTGAASCAVDVSYW